jgi:hypothetical protein
VVEHLPSKHEGLNNPSTAKKKKKKKKKEKKKKRKKERKKSLSGHGGSRL